MFEKIDIDRKIPPVSSSAKGRRVHRREQTPDERQFEKQNERAKKHVKKHPMKQTGSHNTSIGPDKKTESREITDGAHEEDGSDSMDKMQGSLINIRV